MASNVGVGVLRAKRSCLVVALLALVALAGGARGHVTAAERETQPATPDMRQRELEMLRREKALIERAASRHAMQRDAIAGFSVLVTIMGLLLYRRRVTAERLAERLSVTDALTGVKNRRYLEQTIAMDVAASIRRHRTAMQRGSTVEDGDLVFIMLDVDHFKDVNDAYGHDVGDRMLASVAAILRETSRDADVVVRWGGEEFVILGRFTDRGQASATAERLRLAVEGHNLLLPDGKRIGVTCSIGFAAFPFDVSDPHRVSWEQVLTLADLASYAAKRDGRNAWVGYAAAGASVPLKDRMPTLADVDFWVAKGMLARESSRASRPSEAVVTSFTGMPRIIV